MTNDVWVHIYHLSGYPYVTSQWIDVYRSSQVLGIVNIMYPTDTAKGIEDQIAYMTDAVQEHQKRLHQKLGITKDSPSMKTALHFLEKVDANNAIMRWRGGAELDQATLKRYWCPFGKCWRWSATNIQKMYTLDARGNVDFLSTGADVLKDIIHFINYLETTDNASGEKP